MKNFIKNIKKIFQTNPVKFSLKDLTFLLIILIYLFLSVIFSLRNIGDIDVINNLNSVVLIIVPLYGIHETSMLFTKNKEDDVKEGN